MHFHVYLDDGLAQNMARFCDETHKKRNAVVREALQLYLEQQQKKQWPPEILSFQGVDDFPAFESFRSELPADKRTPFLE